MVSGGWDITKPVLMQTVWTGEEDKKLKRCPNDGNTEIINFNIVKGRYTCRIARYKWTSEGRRFKGSLHS
jgi:hypothetical protein